MTVHGLALDARALARARLRNLAETAATLAALCLLAIAIGYLAGGVEGLAVGLGFFAGACVLWAVPGETLFRNALGAVPLSPLAAPGLHAMVAVLSARAGLAAPPRLWLLPQRALQALAAGTSASPGIGVTRSLVEALPPDELAAVLAHEVSHIRNGDLFVMRLAGIASAATRAMAQAGLIVALLFGLGAIGTSPLVPLLLVMSPIFADLLTLSLSRTRELLADAAAASLTGDPAALASALARIERIQGDDFERLAARGPSWLRWLRTHPTVAERIAALGTLVVAPRPEPSPWAPAWPVAPLPPRRRLRRGPWDR